MLDKVLFALGLSDAELIELLDIHRSTLWSWRRHGIPAYRRFQFAEMIEARGGRVPDGLLAPKCEAA